MGHDHPVQRFNWSFPGEGKKGFPGGEESVTGAGPIAVAPGGAQELGGLHFARAGRDVLEEKLRLAGGGGQIFRSRRGAVDALLQAMEDAALGRGQVFEKAVGAPAVFPERSPRGGIV